VFVDKLPSKLTPHNNCAGKIEAIAETSWRPYKVRFDDGAIVPYRRSSLIKIPAPKFEVGKRYKHPLYGITVINMREWEKDWVYYYDENSTFSQESYFANCLIPATEWEPGMWAYYQGWILFKVSKINGNLLESANGWKHLASDCVHVDHIQIHGRKCSCGEKH